MSEMSKSQLDLFSLDQRRWVEALWRQCGPEKRKEVIALLAEMARRTLGANPERKNGEAGDER